MKTQKVKHTEMSNIRCKHNGCKKYIKLNVANRKENPTLCYKHYCEAEARRGHTLNTQPRAKRIIAGLPVKTFNIGV